MTETKRRRHKNEESRFFDDGYCPLSSLMTPAFADGNGKVRTKKTTDKNGGSTITSSMEIPPSQLPEGSITPNLVSSGDGYYFIAVLFSNPVVGYYSGSSTSYTASDKENYLDLWYISVDIAMYKKETGGRLIEVSSDYDHQTYAHYAYKNDYFTREPLVDYVAKSSHNFQDESVQWTPKLTLD